MERDRSISTRVVEAVAEQEGTDPSEMRPPIYDVIDPDGLDELFPERLGDHQNTARVEFTYGDYLVTVEASGVIDVAERTTDGKDEQVTSPTGTS